MSAALETVARTAARALVECLLEQGVSLAFAVAGESYLDVLDALYDVRGRLRVVTCRHEANAANMAEAVGKLTGRPGVCFVTRGPGATHASIAVHTTSARCSAASRSGSSRSRTRRGCRSSSRVPSRSRSMAGRARWS
jgi:acetolactate synthase-1/2/3 large subunit